MKSASRHDPSAGPASDRGDEQSLVVAPIGYVTTPYKSKVSAPRQPDDASLGTIELLPGHGYEHAVEDLEGFEHIWIVFWFHLNEGWRPKVLPPRSEKKRGVFATRSPHRPNPIGMSLVRLLHVSGLTLEVAGVDLIDGTPVLDIKPYIPYADARPGSRSGWLEQPAEREEPTTPNSSRPVDPIPPYKVEVRSRAREQLTWLHSQGVELEAEMAQILSIEPRPHPYRRIKAHGRGYLLALHEWRIVFRIRDHVAIVESVHSGYRARQLALDQGGQLDVHRAFVAAFGTLDTPSDD